MKLFMLIFYLINRFLQESQAYDFFQQVQTLFNELDQDKDGFVTSQDIRRKFVGISEEEIREIFDLFDTSQTGVLNFNQLYHLMEQNKQTNEQENSIGNQKEDKESVKNINNSTIDAEDLNMGLEN